MDSSIVTALLLLLLGLAFLGGGVMMVRPQLQAVAQAEPVEATVVSAEVSEYQNAEAQVRHQPHVVYRYTYEGTEYTSESVFPGGDHPTSEARAEEIVADHAPGDQVTAHVVPGEPESAYLVEASVPLWQYGVTALGALLTLVGAIGAGKALLGIDQSPQAGV